MIDQAQTAKFKDILTLSKNTLVIFPSLSNVADLDLFLASYCLFTFLSDKSEARLLSPKFKLKMPAEISALLKLQKVEGQLGKENLLISFPYQEEHVDKVSYYIGEQDQRFYLTIKPKSGVTPLDSAQVEFSYAGTQADCLVLLGVEDLENLEQLYFAYESLYKNNNNHLVTINSFIPDFGTLNLDISPANSYCEAVFYLLKDLAEDGDFLAQSNLPTLLLYGIEHKSNGLQALTVNAQTFMAVAELLNLGANRLFHLAEEKKPKLKKPEEIKVQNSLRAHSIK
jgi:hypothetical protein